MELRSLLTKVLEGYTLTVEESRELASHIVRGKLQEAQTAGALIAMKVRGESPTEVIGFAEAMRESMIKVSGPSRSVDTAGTGGDTYGTLNVSTAVALLVSSLVPVAKHGNRAVSSSSGSADVLEELGYSIDVEPQQVEELLTSVGFVFLFAQKYHPAMKNVAPVRRALGVKTVFNLLGPLTNPAQVRRQLVGVYSKRAVELLSHAVPELGYEKVVLVHGEPGLDEVSPCCETHITEVTPHGAETYSLFPADLGVSSVSLERVKVENARESALRILRAFAGLDKDSRNFIKLNAALALYAAGVVSSPKDGAELAEQCFVDSLERVRKIVESHGDPNRFEEVKRIALA
ncbi:anthranilate phosphoribosyltransferase [Sulfodiicoccus acidiphilus]|uniref:Anthranilate phosphoribosyltransferase n=1 Tax=Sulfodiicoccus acidiphilus TaxID=1670455 RepID=A0A348B3F0_9CREN|nr:anthranilate phosphoribosyltransferase [Sulfodiicoccus acidiphilus]BBD72702.1 anthranilate phosphoribosyltransferase [Sulfodiicoccus acidiphilus]GGT95407.1 anthranilate phosphoribosyltransferase [Sulfodiicoccus acidiphilus]